MKKPFMFTLGSIEVILGLLLVCTTSIIEQLFPKLGYAAYLIFQGSYSEGAYDVSFPAVTIISVIFIVLGAVQILYSFFPSKNK